MIKIYFNNNFIAFLPLGADVPVGVEICEFNFTKMLKKVENNKNVAVFCNDCYKKIEEFSTFFEVRHAAGGLVESESGKYLMIFRNNCWDLPKGHLEKGETIEQCAVREVSEECGLQGITLKEFLCETMHVYPLKGKLILKKTSWYSMLASQNEQLIPQTVEGITEVKWLEINELAEVRRNTYQSILEVLQNIDEA